EGGMDRHHPLRADEDGKRHRQHQRGQQLHAAQFRSARGIALRRDREGAGKSPSHAGFRTIQALIPRSGVSDVSKNAGPSVASWFKTAQEGLLTMRVRELIYAVAGQKEGPPKRA